jgi:hypothetical protein
MRKNKGLTAELRRRCKAELGRRNGKNLGRARSRIITSSTLCGLLLFGRGCLSCPPGGMVEKAASDPNFARNDRERYERR